MHCRGVGGGVTRIADTIACELAQSAWLGHDAPGAITDAGVRTALLGLPGGFSFEDVCEWATPAVRAISDADSMLALEARVVGALTAALVLGAKLQETNGT